MKRRLAFLALGTLVALTLSSCSHSTGGVIPEKTPTSSASPSSTLTPEVITRPVEFFFVADTPTGFRLFSELHQMGGVGNQVSLSLTSLIDGHVQPFDPDYTNLWGDGTSLNFYSKDGALGTVDLHLGKLNVGAETESRALDQLLWTISKLDSEITSVQILVDGGIVESLAGHVDVSKPIKLEKDYDVLSPLQISSIEQSADASHSISVSGQACTFEANVVWTLKQGENIIKKSSTTAASACPVRSVWSVDLGTLAPGSYTFVAEDFSAKDGSLTARDDKDFTVS